MTETEALKLAHSDAGQKILRMVDNSRQGRLPVGNVNFASVIQLAAWGFIHMQMGMGAVLTIKGTKELSNPDKIL